jgi:hypothetical protein
LYTIAAQALVRLWLCRLAQVLPGHMFGILNLAHWNLFEIWFLVLAIFMIFNKQVTFVYSANYLFK